MIANYGAIIVGVRILGLGRGRKGGNLVTKIVERTQTRIKWASDDNM
jgi:hypothetical protein